MDLHFDKTTGKANEVIEKELASYYSRAIKEITSYLSLELFKYNRISMEEIPSDVCEKADEYIEEVRDDFINNTLMYNFSDNYINLFDCKQIYKSFNESIGQLEDVYLYRTIYRKSKFHLEFGIMKNIK